MAHGAQLRIVGGVGEEAERKPAGFQDLNLSVAFEQRGHVSGVNERASAEDLVVAAEEAGSATHAAGGFHDGAIDVEQNAGEGDEFVHVVVVEDVGGAVKHVLDGGGDVQRLVAPAGDVEKQNQQTRGADLDEIEEVAADAGAAVKSADPNRGKIGELGGRGLAKFADGSVGPEGNSHAGTVKGGTLAQEIVRW